jgi:hypothetical protein
MLAHRMVTSRLQRPNRDLYPAIGTDIPNRIGRSARIRGMTRCILDGRATVAGRKQWSDRDLNPAIRASVPNRIRHTAEVRGTAWCARHNRLLRCPVEPSLRIKALHRKQDSSAHSQEAKELYDLPTVESVHAHDQSTLFVLYPRTRFPE